MQKKCLKNHKSTISLEFLFRESKTKSSVISLLSFRTIGPIKDLEIVDGCYFSRIELIKYLHRTKQIEKVKCLQQTSMSESVTKPDGLKAPPQKRSATFPVTRSNPSRMSKKSLRQPTSTTGATTALVPESRKLLPLFWTAQGVKQIPLVV